MTINDALAALVADLTAGDVPDPLHQEFTLAAVWYDLCRLAGEPVPASVAAIVDPPPPHPARCVPSPSRRIAARYSLTSRYVRDWGGRWMPQRRIRHPGASVAGRYQWGRGSSLRDSRHAAWATPRTLRVPARLREVI